ncbi:MAG: hypothetical protein ACE5FF_18075 [Saprospiraceae bacterium]
MKREEGNDKELTPKQKLAETLAVALCFLLLLGFFLKVVFF